MNNAPTDYEIHFRVWYSYWLEVMTATINRRIDTLTNALTLILGASVFASSEYSSLFGGAIAILGGCRIAWQFGQKAESARQQSRRYKGLLDQYSQSDISAIISSLSVIEEFDSAALSSLFNPARNRACVSLGLKHREKLTLTEKIISFTAGGNPE